MTYYIHCDGSCYNHPDHNTVGYAAVLSNQFDPDMCEVLNTRTGWGKNGTNNIAEWLALIAGMRLMIEHHSIVQDQKYEIYTDSNLIVGQANGNFRVRNAGLRPYYKQFRELEKRAKGIDFDIIWTSRKNNRAADMYSKFANPYFKEKIKNEITRKNIIPIPGCQDEHRRYHWPVMFDDVQRRPEGRSA